MRIVAIGWLAAVFCLQAQGLPEISPVLAPVWMHEVLAQHPHERNAFTEGLLIRDGLLIESTGLYGQSTLTIRSWPEGTVLRSLNLPASEFGEGVALAGDRIFQLTWRDGLCHVYDLELRKLKDFRYAGEGWGLTYDGHALIRSDGSATLHFHDPHTFQELHRVTVTDGTRPVALLNELEYVDGLIYANLWMSTRVAVIDPGNGRVRAWLDLSGLHDLMPALADSAAGRDDVLNGIAYDAASGRFLFTGKRWAQSFEVKIDTPLMPTTPRGSERK